MTRVGAAFNTLTEDFRQVAGQLNQITDHVKETALSMEYGYSELAHYQYQGMVPKARQAAEFAAREAQEIIEKQIAAKLTSKSAMLSLGKYFLIERENIKKLGRYFDISAVRDRQSLDPPKYQVPYEGAVEDDLNQMAQHYIGQDRSWILFSVVDLNGYVLACADVDRPALSGDPETDDRNRFKRLLHHPSWVRGSRAGLGKRVEWLPNNLSREDIARHGVDLRLPSLPLAPMIQTYIRNNVTVMTLLSTPLYVEDERFGAIMVAWQ
jgi:methyl-accepting chemotaxis protein